jgi:hypothetical protein
MNRILKITILLLVVLQFVTSFFIVDHTNPQSDPGKDFFQVVNVPSEISSIMKTSCMDCHSNHTDYPWYSNIFPLNVWIDDHVKDGRKHLNFSEWGTYEPKKQAHKMEECFEEIEKGEMPMESYTFIHAEARLDENQRKLLVDWFKNQYQSMSSNLPAE